MLDVVMEHAVLIAAVGALPVELLDRLRPFIKLGRSDYEFWLAIATFVILLFAGIWLGVRRLDQVWKEYYATTSRVQKSLSNVQIAVSVSWIVFSYTWAGTYTTFAATTLDQTFWIQTMWGIGVGIVAGGIAGIVAYLDARKKRPGRT